MKFRLTEKWDNGEKHWSLQCENMISADIYLEFPDSKIPYTWRVETSILEGSGRAKTLEEAQEKCEKIVAKKIRRLTGVLQAAE